MESHVAIINNELDYIYIVIRMDPRHKVDWKMPFMQIKNTYTKQPE